ncbi:Kip2p, partial [Ascoidea rubescens DSM 1968]
SSYSGTISVSIRPRPLSIPHPSGLSNNNLSPSKSKSLWNINDNSNTISTPEFGLFSFDNVFNSNISNSFIYLKIVKNLVANLINGFNATVFAYGMTGSGKTYSMQGNNNDPGLIPLAINEIFSYINNINNNNDVSSNSNQNTTNNSFTIQVSYLEIYNEKLIDLLLPQTQISIPQFNGSNDSIDLKIRDDPIYGIKVIGLTEEIVTSSSQLLNLIKKGDTFRKTASTNFNQRSSRSHAIILIRLINKNNSTKKSTISTLSLCDLAGSERATSQSERRKEGSFINKSLLALSSVISKLSSPNSSLNHINYRDSKLTRLLQPALSGNAIVSILCTIHLSMENFNETINTLRFAARAKNITLNVTKHDGANTNGNFNSNDSQINKDLQKNYEDLKDEYSLLESENRILNERLEHLSRLNDSKRIEQTMIKSEITNSLSHSNLSKINQNLIKNIEDLFKRQDSEIEENNSYISHLENQLKKMEYENSINNNGNYNNNYNNYNNNNNNKELEELIQEQQDTIMDLRETIKNKDRIIKALRTSTRVRDSIL